MINKSKQYRTRDGREVRIYATDGAGDLSVHGAVKCNEVWVACQWYESGKWTGGCDSSCDLIEVRPHIKREVWVNVYRTKDGMPCIGASHPTKEAAGSCFGSDRIACIPITIDCEEGEGL